MTAPRFPTARPDGPTAERQERIAATRRLLRAIRRTRTGPDALAAATRAITDAASALETEAMDGPFWQTGLTSLDNLDFLTADPLEVFPFSPAMGALNPASSIVDLRVEDQVVVGTVEFDETKGGPPFDIAHGGIVALVYDDIVGLAAMINTGGGFTARLTINYRKPTPLFEPIEVRAWFEAREDRKIIARGEMRHDGEVLNEAEGLFILPAGMAPRTATG